MNREKQILRLERVFDQTLKLMALYQECGIRIPSALKGNLGEFTVVMELLRRFPDHEIVYRGGSFPGIDVLIDKELQIQVKTQVKKPPVKSRRYEYDSESSPTIKKAVIDEPKCDIIILVLLYFNDFEDYSKIWKRNIYVFDKHDFKHFSHTFCWSGKSKGDYTIYNILYVKGNPPPRTKKRIDFYNTLEYRKLFERSKDNWSKIESQLQVKG